MSRQNGTNSFKVSVLKDNSAGQGYTYADLKAKRLLPIVTANDYHYMLDGWFVDTNNNRAMDGSEHLLQDTDRFQGARIWSRHSRKIRLGGLISTSDRLTAM